MCNKAIVKLLCIICKNCIDTGIFPDLWKISNIIPVHKKRDKQLLQNHRPVFLLPVLGKILEKIFNSIFKYLPGNNLLCENQSGFRPSDLCEYQVVSIVHKIYVPFDFLIFLMLDLLFWIFQRPVIKYDMKDSSIRLDVWV